MAKSRQCNGMRLVEFQRLSKVPDRVARDGRPCRSSCPSLHADWADAAAASWRAQKPAAHRRYDPAPGGPAPGPSSTGKSPAQSPVRVPAAPRHRSIAWRASRHPRAGAAHRRSPGSRVSTSRKIRSASRTLPMRCSRKPRTRSSLCGVSLNDSSNCCGGFVIAAKAVEDLAFLESQGGAARLEFAKRDRVLRGRRAGVPA